jgi:hypothetical protein
MDAITLKVTRNELLLLTEDNYELLGLLKDNVDLERFRTKGIDQSKRIF